MTDIEALETNLREVLDTAKALLIAEGRETWAAKATRSEALVLQIKKRRTFIARVTVGGLASGALAVATGYGLRDVIPDAATNIALPGFVVAYLSLMGGVFWGLGNSALKAEERELACNRKNATGGLTCAELDKRRAGFSDAIATMVVQLAPHAVEKVNDKRDMNPYDRLRHMQAIAKAVLDAPHAQPRAAR